jgi:hypothetical protein
MLAFCYYKQRIICPSEQCIMKNPFKGGRAFILESVGVIGGLFWALDSNWHYEPLILLILSCIGLLYTGLSLLKKRRGIVSEGVIDEYDQTNAKQIVKEIDTAKPYLRDQIKESYKGLRVRWTVSFQSIAPTRDKMYRVTTLYKGNYPWVYFDVDIEQYPAFKVAKNNHRFFIVGIIEKIGAGTFTVRVEKIS